MHAATLLEWCSDCSAESGEVESHSTLDSRLDRAGLGDSSEPNVGGLIGRGICNRQYYTFNVGLQLEKVEC